jgi:hypothetical protein
MRELQGGPGGANVHTPSVLRRFSPSTQSEQVFYHSGRSVAAGPAGIERGPRGRARPPAPARTSSYSSRSRRSLAIYSVASTARLRCGAVD